jgi:BirA family biotin operon repressor/biotin-[acetyl-CoA-carboxylase] ligase
LSTSDNVGAMDGVNANWLENAGENGPVARGRWRVRVVSETGSTNADLLAVIGGGVPDRAVLRTDHQTAGRGRLGRTWEAPPGANLLVSILFRGVGEPAHRMTQLLGASCALVLRREFGIAAGLKWPNDVVVSRADGDVKIAGILAQVGVVASDGRVDVVVGMGLNVGWAPPPEIAPATCVRNESANASSALPHDVLMKILDTFDELESMTVDEAFATYESLLTTVGKRVRCELPDGENITGRAVGVEADGRLRIVDECAVTHRVDTADVVHLRSAD